VSVAMTVEERLARIEALLVLLVDQLQFAFPGKGAMRHYRPQTPDFSGEGRLGKQDVFDPSREAFASVMVSDPDTEVFVRTRVANILAAVDAIREDL
jgi:hypothetical protein